MIKETPEKLHASSVAIGGCGVMLTGPSGVGKSDLALRLIDRGAELVSDDYTELSYANNQVMLCAPATIAGKIEIASLGIFIMGHVTNIPLRLKVKLKHDAERYPMDSQTETILGTPVRTVSIDPRPASAPIKVEMALKHLLEEQKKP